MQVYITIIIKEEDRKFRVEEEEHGRDWRGTAKDGNGVKTIHVQCSQDIKINR